MSVRAFQSRHVKRPTMLSKCQICLEDVNPSVVTKCGHIYCRPCLDKWMAGAAESCQNCPTCKRRLKSEEFQELTSGVCCICKMKPKLPVLTSSGSLSCWACYLTSTACLYNTFTPIYGTETESEENADSAVLPRPILQPDVAITTTANSTRPSERTHVVPMDDVSSYAQRATTNANSRPERTHIVPMDDVSNDTENLDSDDFIVIFVVCALIVIMMFVSSVGVFFLEFSRNTDTQKFVMCGILVGADLFSLIILGIRSLKSLNVKKEILLVLYLIGRLTTLVTFITIFMYTHPSDENKFRSIWVICGSLSQLVFAFVLFAFRKN